MLLILNDNRILILFVMALFFIPSINANRAAKIQDKKIFNISWFNLYLLYNKN